MTQQTPEPLSALPDEGLVERLQTDAAWLARRSKCGVVAADIREAATALLAHQAEIDRLRADVERLREMLGEARLQLEYLDGKFTRTGTTTTVVARIRAALRESDRG